MRHKKPSINEIYHVYNRGVDKRVIFTSSEEYSYFLHALYIFNSEVSKQNVSRKFKNDSITKPNTSSNNEGGPTSIIIEKMNDEKLVEVLAFVLLPNHYHLLLRQVTDNGISKFMQKIGTGYTMFFNEQHCRSGSLFQGKYKFVHIQNQNQLFYIPHYIHLNPIQHMLNTSTETEDVLEYLYNFKWSSFQNYVGKKNFTSILNIFSIRNLFSNEKDYIKDIKNIIIDKQKFKHLDNDILIDFV